jgi:peptidylprolyl isomerase
MAKAKSGDRVRVHYTGKLGDGTVFDSSAESDPIEFTIGEGQLIPGFEGALVGMASGDKKSVDLACDDAYGPRHDELVVLVERKEFPEGADLQVGQKVRMTQPNGKSFLVVIAEVGEEKVKLDANHPLAGHDLTFEIELVEIL